MIINYGIKKSIRIENIMELPLLDYNQIVKVHTSPNSHKEILKTYATAEEARRVIRNMRFAFLDDKEEFTL